MLYSRTAVLCAALMLAAGPAIAADNAKGAVEQTGGNNVSQKPSLPKLNLTDAQRQEISKILTQKNSQIEFNLKTTKKAKDFNPQVGAKLPKGVKPDGLPS